MTIDPLDFRRALSRFTTGVTVVAVEHEGTISGFTANAFCSVSLDPPLILVCVGNHNATLAPLMASGRFSVNILTNDQIAIARCFASKNPEKIERFCGAPHHVESTGAPVLDDSLAWLDCQVYASYPGGDHQIVVGEVIALASGEASPLLYVNGHYDSLPPANND